MNERSLNMMFFETYHYANIVHNILLDTFSYLQKMHSWHEDRAVDLFLTPYRKRNVLHDLASYVIEELMYEQLEDELAKQHSIAALLRDSRAQLWVDQALKHHGFETAGFRQWLSQNGKSLEDATEDDVHEYHMELRLAGPLDELLEQLANEVFYLLFANRTLLANLNTFAASVVSDISRDELAIDDKILTRDGVPTRVTPPEWARRAVFFRDRGRCTQCNVDLSGLLSINDTEHYDHIVPLAVGGINDVTNLQLLCGPCNLKKGKRSLPTSNRYQPWYS